MSLTAALVSRQFVDMSRVRIEGLLAAFPKLVGSGKQHTYVETENVRYVYQPMEARTTLPSPVRIQCCGSPCARMRHMQTPVHSPLFVRG